MAYLYVDHVGKTFPGVTALDDIELEIEMGKVHTLAGENGAGKSTLVKILTGTERPTSGSLIINGEDAAEHSHLYKTVAYVPQEINLFTNLTVAENLFMPFSRSHHGGMVFRRRQLEREAQSWIERFNIAAQPSDKVGNISISDQQLLQIARACTNESMKILILDEPTSSLTETEVERVFRVVRDVVAKGCGVMFISHKFDEMFAISDTISVLRNGQKIDTQPVSQLDDKQLVKLMSGQEIKTDAQLQPDESDSAHEVLLEVVGLSGKRFEDVSFQLQRGEILGFAGLVGAGRSEVMQTLFGYLPARAGTLRVEGQEWQLGNTSKSVHNGLFYLSEERKYHGIFPGQSVRRNIGMALFGETAVRGFIDSRKERGRVSAIVRDYDIKTPTLNKDITFLSGGNQQKAIIGRAMACNPKVLIFDEPTKGIDLRTKMEIYRLMKELAERGVGIILVSSEMDELQRCANRIITMYEGHISGDFNIENATGADLVGAIHGHGGDGDAA
ncbi:sugar ABC transporter ATP-binding protein [Chromohalobacter moromii]|uniref:Sugar ABC transporter ATP-binding protein n=1 Tax=Chromohalobacter moromii TaxID=2860329 RepID=A0A9X2X296_9GAMM|nr:sugar ABC transporter ATP-binding protein [Chromohalobacter moromii]MCK2046298.1 sugar ABC transporter ATP-binding protein [Chromohalobacter moromii]MCT8505278.1 sugar ABC transporter ATP-binding protein [Chromohalobacter moromii]